MWSRREGKPLWEMVCDMEPEELVAVIDFKHITDVITPAAALELLSGPAQGGYAPVAFLRSRSGSYGAFVWERRALSSQKRPFPDRRLEQSSFVCSSAVQFRAV